MWAGALRYVLLRHWSGIIVIVYAAIVIKPCNQRFCQNDKTSGKDHLSAHIRYYVRSGNIYLLTYRLIKDRLISGKVTLLDSRKIVHYHNKSSCIQSVLDT